MTSTTPAALSADDVLEIRDIVSTWNISEDEGDAERWARMFTDDGVCQYGHGGSDVGYETLLKGAEERAVDEKMFSWAHWTFGEPTVMPTAEGAIMRHYYATLDASAPGVVDFYSLTEREYRVAKADGRWRIVERTIRKLPLGLIPEGERPDSGAPTMTRTTADTAADTAAAVDRATGTLTALDRLEIQDLLTRYSVAEDTGDADAAASLFVDEGATVNPKGVATVGREAIRKAARKRWEEPSNHTKVHWAANVLITPTDEGAAAQSYNIIVNADESGPRIQSMVAKRDRLRREGGRWLFVERRVEPIGRKPQRDEGVQA